MLQLLQRINVCYRLRSRSLEVICFRSWNRSHRWNVEQAEFRVVLVASASKRLEAHKTPPATRRGFDVARAPRLIPASRQYRPVRQGETAPIFIMNRGSVLQRVGRQWRARPVAPDDDMIDRAIFIPASLCVERTLDGARASRRTRLPPDCDHGGTSRNASITPSTRRVEAEFHFTQRSAKCVRSQPDIGRWNA